MPAPLFAALFETVVLVRTTSLGAVLTMTPAPTVVPAPAPSIVIALVIDTFSGYVPGSSTMRFPATATEWAYTIVLHLLTVQSPLLTPVTGLTSRSPDNA